MTSSTAVKMSVALMILGAIVAAMYVHVYLWLYIRLYVFMYECVYVRMYVVSVYIFEVFLYISTYMCVCVFDLCVGKRKEGVGNDRRKDRSRNESNYSSVCCMRNVHFDKYLAYNRSFILLH